MTRATGDVAGDLSFGPFCLNVGQRLLAKEGVPVELGARALDLLIALASAPNTLLSKSDLMSRIWPDVVVEEGNLRFHMTGLRKALGDGQDGARYITTIPGRGYCFVAPIKGSAHVLVTDDGAAKFRHANLPNRLERMVGREGDILDLSNRVSRFPVVSIVGAGGVGKTTVAIALANHLATTFDGAAVLADFGTLSDPSLVSPALASMLGIPVGSDDVRPNLLAYLRDKRILLVFDTCEHVIDTVADLASSIIDAAPQVRILVTSREALRIEGESIYKLDTLACAPVDPEMTAEAILSYPASQLFVERIAASGAAFNMTDDDARVVAAICRKLDGMALALELAARRVEAYGLTQTAALLDQHFALAWAGSRNAPLRQKTLQATLDWSFGLLSELDRTVLERLAVFVGDFTLDAAWEVIATPSLDRPALFGSIDSLVAKSLLSASSFGAMMRYRLLDTTRAYALHRQNEDDRSKLASSHASYYRRWLEQFGPDWPSLSSGPERLPYFLGINNVRAALEWAFSDSSNVDVGISLAAAAVPVFQAMSLFPECQRWSERALSAMGDHHRGSREEMHLQAGRGISRMYLHGGRETLPALTRSLEIAEGRGDAVDQLKVLGPLNMFHLRTGDFKSALQCASRCSSVAEATGEASAISLGHFFLGNSLHFSGKLSRARVELEAALSSDPLPSRAPGSYVGFQGRGLAGGILARNLWLQGLPDQAEFRARQTIKEAAEADHSLTLCIALLGGIAVFLWRGDLESAEEHINWLISRAGLHSLSPYVSVARGFEAEIAIRRGDAVAGIDSLRRCVERLHASNYEVFTTMLELSLIEGLMKIGHVNEGFGRVETAINLVETKGDFCYLPELMRTKAHLLLAMSTAGEAGACLAAAIEAGRKMGAKGWRLRSTRDLAALLVASDKLDDAAALLRPVVEEFDEGHATDDLETSKEVLSRCVT
ncbi:putative ATPase/DNA-binding winged helix-turn-helix (wHTH) protein [Rhizobium sp. BK181]|uniref:ATP-binding protein n=1 Tax=Rhizobium sp. BK181 TaxID=2587072 RepID=UPI00160FA0C2|nr:winged helix-turn-helix domain-containing protein [Rhizobium sp. BK181]MBB3314631.1 putative ATPase/DNA-binding winged helix-turn-helix (wHTH) protein [Rhizobium sp. BK181]